MLGAFPEDSWLIARWTNNNNNEVSNILEISQIFETFIWLNLQFGLIYSENLKVEFMTSADDYLTR